MDAPLQVLILTNSRFMPDDRLFCEIRRAVPGISVTVCLQDDITFEILKKADVIFGWPDRQQLAQAGNLRWLHLPSAGNEGYADKSIYCRDDIMLTNSGGIYGIHMAEHALAMILAFNRNLMIYDRDRAVRKWVRIWDVKDFYGSVVGILGLGGAGTEIAKRSKALGAKVIACKRTASDVPEYVDELVYGDAGIDRLLALSDYVILVLPDTPSTAGIISADRLKKMKPGAFIVNVGRGAAIDEDALIKALQEGWIAGAGLDVTVGEPLPADNPLWELPNVILSMHTSGFSPQNGEEQVNLFIRNLIRYAEGKPLQNVVNFEAGY